MTKSKRGPLKDTTPEVMLAHVLKAVITESKIDKSRIEDLACGNVMQPGAGAMQTRAAQLMAGIPVTSTAVAVNRQCSSGIEACSIIASKIKAGIIDVGIGAGVESMSMYNMMELVDPSSLSDELFENENARNCLIPMGNTADTVAKKYNLNRAELDQFAVDSH